jgi:UDP-glucose 4-epimerase
MIQNKTIFITGGAGFIASHLIERLIDHNKVIIYDNLHRNALQYYPAKDHPNITFIKGDVLDEKLLMESMKGADICVHAAAIAGIYSVGSSISRTIKVNLIGAYNALEAAIANKVEKFIDFSTSEVYGPFVYRGKESGNTTQGPIHEKRWIYAVSKLASEYLSHAYDQDFNLNVSSIRPFNVYGPRQIGEGAIQQMISRALQNEDITIFNDGTQIRSWCYVTDFVDGLYRMMYRPEASHEVFNIGNPQASMTNLTLAKTIIRLSGSKSNIIFKPHPGPEVEMRIPDIEKAHTLLEFEPQVDLEKGLLETIEWFKGHLDLHKA